MNNAESVLRSLRLQGTTVRAERTTRVYDGVVQPWTAITFAGRMPSPMQMFWVRRLREPIIARLEREQLVNYPQELNLTWDFEFSARQELPDCPGARACLLCRKPADTCSGVLMEAQC